MRHGDLVVTTAIYRSDCPCELTLELARGREFPWCPQCKYSVEWVYQRSTYRPAPAPAPAPEQCAPPVQSASSSSGG